MIHCDRFDAIEDKKVEREKKAIKTNIGRTFVLFYQWTKRERKRKISEVLLSLSNRTDNEN